MDTAIVTGADTAAGAAISRRLVRMGCRVYGLGRDFSQTNFSHPDFKKVATDLTQVETLVEGIKKIGEKEGGCYCYVHAAAYWPDAAERFTTLPVGELEAALKINVYVPTLLARLLLPSIAQVQGHFFQLVRPPDRMAGLEPLWALVDHGTRQFSEQLFDEVGDSGARMTLLRLIGSRETGSGGGRHSRLDPEQAADAVERVMRSRDGNVVTELVIRPQRGTHGPDLPRTQIGVDDYQEVTLPPPENFPREHAPIRTPDRNAEPLEVESDSISEEEAEREAAEAEAALEEEVRLVEEEAGAAAGKSSGSGSTTAETSDEAANNRSRGRGRRRGRRGGRSRERSREREIGEKEVHSTASAEQPEQSDRQGLPQPSSGTEDREATQQSAAASESVKLETARKRSAEARKTADHKAGKAVEEPSTTSPKATEPPVPAEAPPRTVKKAAKKTAKKGSASKAVGKKAARKTTKKAAKKVARKSAKKTSSSQDTQPEA